MQRIGPGLLLTLHLAGCASPRPVTPLPPAKQPPVAPVPRAEPRSAQGNPPFYEVQGKRYFVMPDSSGYLERGVASWYGPGFHEGKTSNGERFDMYALSAAHKTLPLPTWVEVTNLRNGRSITVRVNDRGPFKDGRIIDLSYTAAAQLDMLRDGTTFVEVRALTAELAKAEPPAGAPLFVQAGAFKTEANANNLLSKLGRENLGRSFVQQDTLEGRTLFRVRIGPIDNVAEFDRVVARLKELGISDARLAAE